jgi:Recombination endonuclease VII
MYSRSREIGKIVAKPEDSINGYFKDKPCRCCSKVFSPKAPSHLYCSPVCAEEAADRNYLEGTYGITLEYYRSLLESQDNLCRICKGPGFKLQPKQRILLVVDHCHKTNIVRGLLCHNCNRALGLLKDSTTNLREALSYLESATTIPLREYAESQCLWKRSARPKKPR